MAGAFNPDSMNDFMSAADASYRRYETNIDNICAKYSQPFEDTDIVCMKTGNILNDKGTLKKLKPVQFGGAKLAITKRRADKLMTTLCNSDLDISNKPADTQSMQKEEYYIRSVKKVYSNYVSAAVNQSHIADDATNILSFISAEENEPSDAETISSRDSSNEIEENMSDTTDSYFDDVDGDFNLLQLRIPGAKPGSERKLRDNNKVWYSIGSSSEHSVQESDTSCKKVFGSINSRSREVFSKNEDSESTEDDPRGNASSLSKENIEKLQHTEDSGFESGPGKRVVGDIDHRQPGRMFCLNDDKINRVMNWVKDQAKETVHFRPSESVSGQDDASPADETLGSPVKVRKTDRDNFFPVNRPRIELEPTLLQSHTFKPVDTNMNKTYCVPTGIQGQISKATSDKEITTNLVDSSNISLLRQTTQSWTNDTTTTVFLDNSDVGSYDARTESGCLTPRRMVRARKRAFTPVQPSYTSEQLMDYFTSSMPKTIIEVMSPSCTRVNQTVRDPNITVPTPPPTPEKNLEESDMNCFKFPKQPEILKNIQPQCQETVPFSPKSCDIGDKPQVNEANNMQPTSQMNNLNKDVTRESNTSSADVIITKVKSELGIFVQNHVGQIQSGGQPLHESVVRSDQRRLSEGDDAITLCEGFGRVIQQHDHVLSQVPQTIKPPTDSSKQGTTTVHQCKSAGFNSKKQIFDRLKNAGCFSDSEVQSERKQGKSCVRARRQLAMGQTREGELPKQLSRYEQNKVFVPQSGDEGSEFEAVLSREVVSSEEHSHLSLEEHRVAFMYGQHSAKYHHENMDVDCGESPDNQNGTREVIVNKRVTTDDRKLLMKQENKNGKGSLQRTRQVPDYDTNDRRGRHAEKYLDVSAASIPSSSARQDTKDATSNSPVCCRKPSTVVPGVGLSPSTALSQLQINSPTQIKPNRLTPHKKSSKELFSVSLDSSIKHPHKQPTSCSLKFTKDSVLSPRKKDSLLKDVKRTPRKSLSNGVCHSPKFRELLTDDMSPSPRKRDYNSDVRQTAEKKDYNSDVRQTAEKRDITSSNNLYVFKEPGDRSSAFQTSGQITHFRSSKQSQKSSKSSIKYTDDCHRFSMPSIDSLTRVKSSQNVPKSPSYEYLVTTNDPQKLYTDTKNSKSVQKPEFLVPDKSVFKSLKPIKSLKKKAPEAHVSNLQKDENRFTKNNKPTNIQHLTAIHSSRWTSTPAKGRNVPILNDTMSTIFHGVEDQEGILEDDEEEEVRTISPYSFQSESVMDS